MKKVKLKDLLVAIAHLIAIVSVSYLAVNSILIWFQVEVTYLPIKIGVSLIGITFSMIYITIIEERERKNAKKMKMRNQRKIKEAL